MDPSEIEKRKRRYEIEEQVNDLDPSDVQKRKLLYELEDELWNRLRKRAWIIGAIAVLGGLTAIYTIAKDQVEKVAEAPLKGVEKNLAQAELLVVRAKTDAAAASDAADKVKVVIKGLEDRAQRVDDQFRIVSEQITQESKNAALRSKNDFTAVQKRISALEDLVKTIGEENNATRKATADYAEKVAKLEKTVEQQRQRFAENSLYAVVIRFVPDRKVLAQQIQARLSSVGFKAPMFETTATDTLKGSFLSYAVPTEKKVDEVLELIRPLVKNVQTTKLSETFEFSWTVPLGVLPLQLFDPRSMVLILGT